MRGIVTVGLHLGHHASCAVVVDGEVKAALQQERLSRKKYDGAPTFVNSLPFKTCLEVAGVELKDVTSIVSSVQSAAVGGVGLHYPLVDKDFDLFDVFDKRHRVISHHLAHGMACFGLSPFSKAAVLVADLAGSSTTDGRDFDYSFPQFHEFISRSSGTEHVKSEVFSVYSMEPTGFSLLERHYGIPHPAPDVFVQSAASLYDNVARAIFKSENAHGQMMALASLLDGEIDDDADCGRIVTVSDDGMVYFQNGWQATLNVHRRVLDNVKLARLAQSAFERAILGYARRAKFLSGHSDLALAGGIFLNINANSRILESGLFENVYVPSAPHDAGISVGCAFYGQEVWRRSASPYRFNHASDRLGRSITKEELQEAIRAHPFLDAEWGVAKARIARHLVEGHVVARCSGRAEFGPRALGGRSLLASPCLPSSKDRLNKIKGRQSWRPVAPIVIKERLTEFFSGPDQSPYMNFVHGIREEYREKLPALSHPDGSTRAQGLTREDDPDLYDLIQEFGLVSGFPILVNTSLNGPREPIVDSVADAIDFFVSRRDVVFLLVDDCLLSVNYQLFTGGSYREAPISIASNTAVTVTNTESGSKAILANSKGAVELPVRAAVELLAGVSTLDKLARSLALRESEFFDVVQALLQGILETR